MKTVVERLQKVVSYSELQGIKVVVDALGLGKEDVLELKSHLGLAVEALEKQENDKWVSVDERMPEEYATYLVAWRPVGENADDIMAATESELTHYYEILDFDPDDESGWIETIDQCEEYVILAWRTLPEPYNAHD